MSGRSTIDMLPPAVRDAVHEAIREGATIDRIVERIQEMGAEASRSAVGRYAKEARDLVRRQNDADRIAEIWVREIGARPEGRTGRLAIEALRSLSVTAVGQLGDAAEESGRVDVDELNTLALAIRRIEASGKITTDRELAIKQDATREAAAIVRDEGRAQGLSPEVLDAIDARLMPQ